MTLAGDTNDDAYVADAEWTRLWEHTL